MNCEEVRRHWNLYHDSEGDAALHLAINEHLASCPACAEWFYKQSQFEDSLSRHVAPVHADAQLWESVLSKAGVVSPSLRTSYVRPMLFIASLAAVLIIAVTIGIRQLDESSDETTNLSGIAANWHARLADGDVAAALHSNSDLEVEDYLRRQVAFPVRCPPRKDAGFVVEGAGTCSLADERVAYLVGRVEQTPVSIFILSRESLAAFPHQAAALRKEPVHRCREGQYDMAMSAIDKNIVLVIGRASPEALEKVLRAYGSYHETRG
jgi:anti-sigma factor RsiW